MTRTLLIPAGLLLLAVACPVAAQEKDEKKPEPPKLADVLREKETLTRRVAQLEVALKERDARLQLASFEREGMVRAVILNPQDPDGTKAVQARCSVLEAHLREAEKPAKEATFDCAEMRFRRPPN